MDTSLVPMSDVELGLWKRAVTGAREFREGMCVFLNDPSDFNRDYLLRLANTYKVNFEFVAEQTAARKLKRHLEFEKEKG